MEEMWFGRRICLKETLGASARSPKGRMVFFISRHPAVIAEKLRRRRSRRSILFEVASRLFRDGWKKAFGFGGI